MLTPDEVQALMDERDRLRKRLIPARRILRRLKRPIERDEARIWEIERALCNWHYQFTHPKQ